MTYEKLPIVDAARRCGLMLDARTLRREEVEAACPFCGDHGPGKYHLSLNTSTDQYRCNLCGARGNSVTLYARLHGIGNKEAYCTNIVMDPDIDVQARCRQAEELFELYQRCANRKQIETICANFLREMEATKLSINGHLYFVPRSHMEKVDIFEDFIGLLGGMNRNNTPLVVNSFYIIDDEKQRSKMAEEFYNAVKKEITEYQERCDYFIKSNCQSPAVMERWVLKVRGLEERKRHYEEILRRELDGLAEEFSTLKLLSQELQVRANAIHFQKAA